MRKPGGKGGTAGIVKGELRVFTLPGTVMARVVRLVRLALRSLNIYYTEGFAAFSSLFKGVDFWFGSRNEPHIWDFGTLKVCRTSGIRTSSCLTRPGSLTSTVERLSPRVSRPSIRARPTPLRNSRGSATTLAVPPVVGATEDHDQARAEAPAGPEECQELQRNSPQRCEAIPEPGSACAGLSVAGGWKPAAVRHPGPRGGRCEESRWRYFRLGHTGPPETTREVTREPTEKGDSRLLAKQWRSFRQTKY